jgi:hypothetical protein
MAPYWPKLSNADVERNDAYAPGMWARIDGYLYRLDAPSSRKSYEVEEWIESKLPRKAVSQLASPFKKSSDAGPDGDGPWLGRAETEAIKAAWPKAIKFPPALKFYRLTPLYQSLSTTGGGRIQIRLPAPLEDGSLQFAKSGGMDGLTGWSSVKGLDLGGKKIKVWEEPTDVRAFALVDRWRWRFPVGTVAYDVLRNRDGEVFTVRSMTREEDRWTAGVDFEDLKIAPTGYKPLRACARCHDGNPGAVVGVPGRIYMHVIWGDDQRFSWRPWRDDDATKLDRRWPLE